MRRSLALLGLVGSLLGCAGSTPIRDCTENVCTRWVTNESGFSFTVANQNLMPVTVTADFAGSENARPSLPLPVVAVVPAGATRELVRFTPEDPARTMQASGGVEVFFGSLATRPDPDARYAWPFAGEPRQMTQGVGGVFTHQGVTRYAFDFTMPSGTPVLAARDGVVVKVQDGFRRGGLDPKLKDKANGVVVQHADGTFASYAHLSPGIDVEVGEPVVRGQRLGYSGATGYAQGPHLHFHVGTVFGGEIEGTTVPIRFDDGTPGGRVPLDGEWCGPGTEVAR
jgi:murein DD-endopeptidase MepM/ murein hydrolase activator NlpD